jgi:hypothetical protein
LIETVVVELLWDTDTLFAIDELVLVLELVDTKDSPMDRLVPPRIAVIAEELETDDAASRVAADTVAL